MSERQLSITVVILSITSTDILISVYTHRYRQTQLDNMGYNYGDLTIIYPKPYSIYLRGTIDTCIHFLGGVPGPKP